MTQSVTCRLSHRVSSSGNGVQRHAAEPGIEFGYERSPMGLLAEKIIGVTSVAVILTAMSAFNDDFNRQLLELTSGDLTRKASMLTSQTLRSAETFMESFGMHGGDNTWLLLTAFGAVVVGALMMRR
jgi:hypothetical protein